LALYPEPVRVFVSSASADTTDERNAITEVINALGLIPVKFELFHSRPGAPKDIIFKELEQCDAYIGIFRKSWGHGVTALECNEARRLKLAIFVYESGATLDIQERDRQLAEYLGTISDWEHGLWRKIYRGIDDLKYRVALDLGGWIIDRTRTIELAEKTLEGYTSLLKNFGTKRRIELIAGLSHTRRSTDIDLEGEHPHHPQLMAWRFYKPLTDHFPELNEFPKGRIRQMRETPMLPTTYVFEQDNLIISQKWGFFIRRISSTPDEDIAIRYQSSQCYLLHFELEIPCPECDELRVVPFSFNVGLSPNLPRNYVCNATKQATCGHGHKFSLRVGLGFFVRI